MHLRLFSPLLIKSGEKAMPHWAPPSSSLGLLFLSPSSFASLSHHDFPSRGEDKSFTSLGFLPFFCKWRLVGGRGKLASLGTGWDILLGLWLKDTKLHLKETKNDMVLQGNSIDFFELCTSSSADPNVMWSLLVPVETSLLASTMAGWECSFGSDAKAQLSSFIANKPWNTVPIRPKFGKEFNKKIFLGKIWRFSR